MDQKIMRLCALFFFGGGGAGISIQHNVAWSKAYLRTKWHLDASSRLANGYWPKSEGAAAPFWGG